jgi:hypothetical protein
MVLTPEQNGKMYPVTGNVRYAVLPKMILREKIKRKRI